MNIQTETINGITLDVIQDTVSAIQKEPERGRCKFRVKNRWRDGTINQSSLYDFHANNEEMTHPDEFELGSDEPPMLGGEDSNPNPVEYLLHALASCVTTSMIAHAAVRGIEIEELESEVEGDIDLRGFLGIESSVPRGFTDIRVQFKAKTDEKNLRRLKELAEFSPVLNTIAQGARVTVHVAPAS
jgi:uncharacterized OsmC-like protein